MDTTTPTIPIETARHVLSFFDAHGGCTPGSFTVHLMRAIAAADITNTARLKAAYPDYVAAMNTAQNNHDGITRLQHIAGVGA